MTPRSFLLTPELADYVRASSEAPDEVAADLLAETAALAERGEAPLMYSVSNQLGGSSSGAVTACHPRCG